MLLDSATLMVLHDRVMPLINEPVSYLIDRRAVGSNLTCALQRSAQS